MAKVDDTMALRLLLALLIAGLDSSAYTVLAPNEPEPGSGTGGEHSRTLVRIVRVDVEPMERINPADGSGAEPDNADVTVAINVHVPSSEVAANVYAMQNALAVVRHLVDAVTTVDAGATHRLTTMRATSKSDPADGEQELIATGCVTVTGVLQRSTGATVMTLP